MLAIDLPGVLPQIPIAAVLVAVALCTAIPMVLLPVRPGRVTTIRLPRRRIASEVQRILTWHDDFAERLDALLDAGGRPDEEWLAAEQAKVPGVDPALFDRIAARRYLESLSDESQDAMLAWLAGPDVLVAEQVAIRDRTILAA